MYQDYKLLLNFCILLKIIGDVPNSQRSLNLHKSRLDSTFILTERYASVRRYSESFKETLFFLCKREICCNEKQN